MKIFIRNFQNAFLLITGFAVTLPLSAQLTQAQRERAREHERETRAARLAHPGPVAPPTQETLQLPAPVVVNFTERAEYDLAHPINDSTKRIIMQGEQEDDYKFQPWPISPGAKVCPVPRPTSNGQGGNEMKSTNSPAPLLSFNGILGDGSEIPPDINLAAGVNYVMETTNQSYAIYNKSTGALVRSVSITTFYSSANGNGYFDPHILYDAPHGKWLAVIDGNTSSGHGCIFLAVSQTNDPTGNWWVYTIDDGVASSTLLDFPEMGYNQNWVVLTANLFQNTGVITEVYVMNRASLYSGTIGTITHFTDANSFCVSPAQTMDTTTLIEYLVQDANGNSGGNGYVQIGTISGAVGSPAYTNTTATQVGVSGQPWNENTVQAKQQGTTALIDNDDTRIYASEYINGSLWFAHTVWLPATGTPTYCGVDWWQLNPATRTLQQFGRIADASTPSFYFYPNIYANSAGDALLGYGVSSGSAYASAVYSFHAATDATNSMENLYNYKAGVSTFAPSGFGTDYRWGDYTGVAVDPVDNSFWAAGEWANTSNKWATQIAHVGASAPIATAPVADFSANTTTATCSGNIAFTDLSTNVPTSWLWTFGDGRTSTLQNPTHTYITNGTYTVTLKATNAYGNNTKTATNYITITLPAGPAVTGASHCGAGTFSLSATTTNPVKWYDSTGTLLSASNPYVTPVLNHTTAYYVADSMIAPVYHVGPASNTVASTSGGYLNTTYGLNFNVMKAGLLQSVYVYAQTAGSITINVANSGGTVVNTATVSVPAGGSTVALNFPLVVGNGYLMTFSGSISLYRNTAGASYPYTDADGIVSITGNNAGTVPAYYYFFYDWVVKEYDCTSTTVPVLATLTAGITASSSGVTNVACNGSTNGSATITASGGTPAYTYTWSNGQTSATLTGVAAGSYTVTVHDGTGCSGTASQTISQPSALNVSVTGTNASCGSSTGNASASVSGGTSGYAYLWSNAATTSTISNLAAGTYTLTVTDSHSCTAVSSTTITSTGGLTLSTHNSAPTCNGAATGSATVSTSGGTGNITYHWSNGATTSTISNVVAGTYQVTVSDANGCSGTASNTVNQPPAINISISKTNSGCGSPNGTATANVTGGTGGYTYSWSNAAATAAISNLSAGTYFVTVTDNNHCTSTSSVVISNSGLLNVSATPSAGNCSGGSTGGANATINGGTAPFTYHWSNGSTAASISGVVAGTYLVTVSDNGGCSGTASVVVATGAALNVTNSSSNVNCFNGGNGGASVTVTSGTSPYHYNWSNGSTTASVGGLTAGNYYVTITDANNCQRTDTIAVTQPNSITIFVSTVQPSCAGLTNASASVSATGGTPGYSYLWSNGATGSGISNLATGNYAVTLTDTHTCTSAATFSITDPVPVSASFVEVNDSCYQDNNGSVLINPLGGTAPYTYLWSNGSTAATLSGLTAGVYFVTVTDNHNCSSTASATVTQPNPLAVTTSSTDATNGQANGSATVTGATGGNAPYNVTWSNGGVGNTITGVVAGNYTVTVTDHNGCETTATVVVNNLVGINSVNSDFSFTIYPNPAKTEITIDAPNLDKETSLTLEDVLGQVLVTKNINSTTTKIELNNLSNGVYFIELRQGGKRALRKFVVNR